VAPSPTYTLARLDAGRSAPAADVASTSEKGFTVENQSGLSRRAALGAALAIGAISAGRANAAPADKLKELGITLPTLGPALGSYAPFVQDGKLLYVSGQLPLVDGKPTAVGIVPTTVSPADANAAARQCAINIIAAVSKACDGDLTKVARVVKLTGYVAATPDFTAHPAVMNGASDLMKAAKR
jgi:enamine deaminase RidA (YjgF/YER057c/UK114 family)